ncbi:MAG: inositol monophosphatase [Pseudomonadota bacterium]
MALLNLIPTSPGSLPEAMGDVLREAAEHSVRPRFQKLNATDVEEKTPGDLVTVADREAEIVISAGLAELRPGARIVGEEACADNPALLKELDQGEVWVIDPIDGTSNYAAGKAPFAIMAALIRNGQPIASAIMDPLADDLFLAELGSGAWVNGARIKPASPEDLSSVMTGIVSHFRRPSAMDTQVAKLCASGVKVVPTQRCAGFEYPMIATGERQFALYWRTLVWDHAPGVLMLKEAGGKAAKLNGSPYRASMVSEPFLLAANEAIWANIKSVMRG